MTILVLIHSPFRMWTIPSAHVERLRERFPEHDIVHAASDADALRGAAEIDVAFSSQINPDILAAAPRLKWVHSPAAGIAGMLYREMVERDVVLTNARGMSAETIAEHVVAVTLALFRRLPLAVDRQREHTWAQDEIAAPSGNRRLAGSRVLIVGAGSIGQAAGVRLHALGARVTGIRRKADGALPAGFESMRGADALASALPDADVVVIAAPQTPSTRGLIGESELALMRRDAVLVNVSRGGLIDETALIDALRQGRLAGAALDVFRNEPLSQDSPLWDVPNLLITPHTSGFRHDHWDAAVDLFAENLRRFEEGRPLLNVVDKRAGY